MLGIALSLLSAFSFAMNNVLIRRGVTAASPAQGIFVTVWLGVPLFLIAALATGHLSRAGELSWLAYVWLAAAGIVHFIIGRYGNYRSIQAMGANRVAPVQSLSIPYSVAVAVILFDETVTLLMAIGIALIIVGPLIMVQRRRAAVAVGAAPASSQTFAPKLAEGYLWGAISSLSYGTSPLFIKAAIEDIPVSMFGGFVSYLAAGLVLLFIMSPVKRAQHLRSINGMSFRFFLAGGTSVFFAQLFRYAALAVAPVSIVTPLLRMGDVFTLFLSFFMNRRMESFGPRVVGGILISVAGALLLAL